jgi:SSS family solute:Na+ symporter
VGGWDSLREQVLAKGPEYQDHFTLLLPHDTPTPYPWTGIVFGLGLVMSTAYMAGNQAIVQRTLGARSEWDAKGGMLFAGFLKVFIPVMIVMPAIAAIVLLEKPVDNPDTAVPTLIRDLLPPGLTGLMFAALFAALMSSVDSYLNSASTIWTTDLYGRFVRMFTRQPIASRHGLIVGRIFTVVFIVSAGFVAPAMEGQESMYTFIQTALSMFQGPVLAILLLGILWRGTTQWGGLAGLVLGIAFTTILNNTEGVFPSENPFLFVAWWSFVFSMIVTIVVSLITPREPEEKIRGLIFGQVLHDGELQRVLQTRAENAETR